MSISDPGIVRAHLIAAARAGSAVTYSELLGQLGYPFSRPRMRALCKTLGAVDAEAEALGEPELAVLVVRQSDGLPGQGWWITGAAAHGHDGPWEGPAARALIEAVQARAFDYWARRWQTG